MVVYTHAMESGAGFFVFIWIIFIAWLMWSSKAAKENFHFYPVTASIGGGIANPKGSKPKGCTAHLEWLKAEHDGFRQCVMGGHG